MIGVLAVALAAAFMLLGSIIWSIAYPEKRIWPPKKSNLLNKIFVWFLTLIIFGGAFYLGLGDWNRFGWSAMVRWGLGLPAIILGNVIVWWGVAQIGIGATSGEATELRTDGVYRYSRNPQYLADMVFIVGWNILSASLWVLPVTAVGLILLAITPLAEEPWLVDVYGEKYIRYRQEVPRFL